MANQEQLKILMQGVEVWNQWRKDHPDETIDLREVHLNGTDLNGINFNRANLYGANLSVSDMKGAKFHDAYLGMVNLGATNLHGANLFGASLIGASLVHANFYKAIITGVNFYGTAREDWKVDGVTCEYVFWDAEGKKRTPPDRDFRPGEFEELYKQLPTFEYVFEHGLTALDTVVMARIVDTINQQHPEFKLDLVNFDKRGQPHATFTVLHKENVEAAQTQVSAQYEQRILRLEAQKEQLMDVIRMLGSGGVKLQPITDGGITIRPVLPAALTQAIVAFLVTLPNIQDHQVQQAFLYSAGLDAALLAQLHVNQPPKPFIDLLVSSCISYGQMADGRHALIAVLEAAKQLVGVNRQAEAETLIQQIMQALHG